MESIYPAAIDLIDGELAKARKKHPPMTTAHYGYAVILEKLDELWDEIKQQNPDREKLIKEAAQIGAMAAAFLAEVCNVTASGPDLKTAGRFLRELANKGGCIVSSAACSESEIAMARACERFYVDDDSLGYVHRPKVQLKPVCSCTRSDAWRGAREGNLDRVIACPCVCHRFERIDQ